MKRKLIACLLAIVIASVSLSGCIGNNPPKAYFLFSPSSPTTEDNIIFTDNSTDPDGTIASWLWNFGDGSTKSGEQVNHSYDSAGTYNVTLKVTDDGGATDSYTVSITVYSAIEITKEEAIGILMREIIEPSSSGDRVSAFMLSQPLQKDDNVTSDSGEWYDIESYTWFIFIDDNPKAFFAHATRYVLINARNGSYEIINETWPPLVNNISMFDTANLSRGDIIEIYPLLNSSVPISGGEGTAPSGDYGDAPDGQNAYNGIQGRFPTLYNTTYSKFGRPGGHTSTVGEETLGINVSAEVDANDSNDPDGVPNLVDSDSDERMFVVLDGENAKLSFTVTVNQSAPNVTRYLNVLIDFDQTGNWSAGSYGSEWVVVNLEVNVSPGSSETIITPEFSWGNKSILPSPVWMRVALTRGKVNETLFSSAGGWDGSGQFQYGEIEDHIIYLTDNPPDPEEEWPPWPGNPPGGKNPNPPPPPGPQPPGPSKGPCGTDVNYHVIIISGGDSSKHLSKGQNPAKQAVDTMSDLAEDQGYNSVANLGPGKQGDNKTTIANIGKAFDNLKSQVKCGDHVLIYIIGHGKPANQGGGITLRGSNGKTKETMKPDDLANFLDKIPSCPDEECDVEGKCCHVTVVIESCYAGNFNVDGVKGEGRTVMGSCDDEPADASNGGVFSSGFNQASRDEDGDINDDDVVDPTEAYERAQDAVDENNKKTGRGQEPWIDSQECECKCPCTPSIDTDKWVWDNIAEEWVGEIDASLGATVRFRCEIENDGECRNVTNLTIVDVLPDCLSYGNDAILYYDEESMGLRPPCSTVDVDGGLELTWHLTEIELFAPGETIAIEYNATTEIDGENINSVNGSANCTYDPSVVVYDEDIATVNVDDTLPETTKELGKGGEDGYNVTQETPIWLNATDEGSGVGYINYSILWDENGDNETAESWMCNITVYGNAIKINITDCVNESGLIELRWYAVDKVGNKEVINIQQHFVNIL